MKPGLDFQERVFDLVSKRLREVWPGSTLSVTDFKTGPIDVIASIRRKDQTPSLAYEKAGEIEELLYIECKEHAKKIGLDVTGKAYCVALADQPDYLIIVSKKGLEPQALNFASRLFKCAGITNLVIDGSGTRILPLSPTNFLHYTLDDLEAHSGSQSNDKAVQQSLPKIKPDFSLVSWQIISQKNDEVMFSNDMQENCNSLSLLSNDSYFIDFSLDINRNIVGDEKLSVSLTSGEKALQKKPKSAKTDNVSFLNARFILGADELTILSSTRNVKLEITTSNGPSLIDIELPHIETIKNFNIFPDLRPYLTQKLTKKLMEDNKPSCVSIEGSGGVGKSYLVAHLCNYLIDGYGFSVRKFNLTSKTPRSFLFNLVLELLPNVGNIDTPPNEELLSAILSSLAIGPKSNPLRGKQSLNFENLTSEEFCLLCTQVIKNITKPTVFVFEDCHLAAPDILNLMGDVLKCLSVETKIKSFFIFEHRNEATTSKGWLTFKDETRDSFGEHFISEELNELSSHDVSVAMKPLFPDVFQTEITSAVYQKSGGTPLYMEHILRHFLTMGYITTISKEVTFIIKDIGGIRHELVNYDENITHFLQRRIHSLLNKNADPVLNKVIWLYSLSNEYTDTEKLSLVLGNEKEKLNLSIKKLIAEGVLRESSLNGVICFAHDLMYLAAKKVPLENSQKIDLSEALTKQLNKRTPLDCIVVGEALSSVQRPNEAEEWLQNGFETCSRSNYYFQRLILRQLDTVLSHKVLNSIQDKTKWLDVKMHLGWAELQGGSLIEARKAYANVEKLCLLPFDTMDPSTRRVEKLYQLKSLHRSATVNVEMMDIQSALGNLKKLFSVIKDQNFLFHASNRLLLALTHIGQAELAHKVAPYCLSLGLDCTDEDSTSVIMSDLGTLYFNEYPSFSQELWEIGDETAIDARQKTHSETNLLIGRFVNKQKVKLEESEKLLTRMKDLRLSGQYTRLLLLQGAIFLEKGQYENAQEKFFKALKQAISQNQTILRWIAIWNFAYLERKIGDETSAQKYFLDLTNELTDFRHKTSLLDSECQEVCDQFIRACNNVSVQPTSTFQEYNLPPLLTKAGYIQGILKRTQSSMDDTIPHSQANDAGGYLFQSEKGICYLF